MVEQQQKRVIDSGPKHRSSGNVVIPRLSIPVPPDRRRPSVTDARECLNSMWTFVQLQVRRQGVVICVMVAGVACWLIVCPRGAADPENIVTDFGFGVLDKLYEQKLKAIASGITSLEDLSQIIVKADETYEDVYHNQLVQQTKDSRDPHEADWNSFVQEARLTGPAFLAGKEKLREAVANMQRLIRRAPEYLRSTVQWWSKHDFEEASWYLSKVVKLVDSVHSSMEAAANHFTSAETSVDGMGRDAKENADHFENQASSLQGELKELEGTPLVSKGRWHRTVDKALYGCQLEKLRAPLDECKAKCAEHVSGSCRSLTYYKTAYRNSCYLHCESATTSSYRDGDTYILERAPSELASDLSDKTHAAAVAAGLRVRWQNVQAPLREVTRLVRRFRGATADLRMSLEDARFATDDLLAAFNPGESTNVETDRELRIMERRVEDVVTAIEDLGDSLAIIRFS